MATVGIIGNPAAGKDIRRLVAHGRLVPNQEKINTIKRILAGLDATRVERVVFMPDSAMLGRAAIERARFSFEVQFLDMAVSNGEEDSSKAAGLMACMGVDCIVTLGGDGTNRAVAKGSQNIPLVPVSTGTNNVFPSMVEGTVAGMAAGVVARGLIDVDEATSATRRLEIHQDGSLRDIALVDVAVSKESFVGARAIWNMDTVHEIFLARAAPGAIGLSAIGAQLPLEPESDDAGMHLRLGPGGATVWAPLAPGVVSPVEVGEWRPLSMGEPVEVELRPCILALDGERTLSLLPGSAAYVSLSEKGPTVVDVEFALREAARYGVFVERSLPARIDGHPPKNAR